MDSRLTRSGRLRPSTHRRSAIGSASTACGRTVLPGTRPKGAIDPDSLRELVEQEMTLSEIAAEVGRSITTVRYWIRRYGLPSPRNVRRAELDRAIAEGRRTLMKQCGKHGWTTFVLENSGRTRCRRCRMDAVSEWRDRSSGCGARSRSAFCCAATATRKWRPVSRNCETRTPPGGLEPPLHD